MNRSAAVALASRAPDTARRMSYTVYSLARRARLRREFSRLHAVAWPPFLRDDAVNALWPRLYSDFPEYQIGLADGAGRVVAIGNTIPLRWDGTPRDLPDRVVDAIARGIAARERRARPTALCALAAVVDPRRRARGLSTRIVSAMRDVASAHGFPNLVAPVRPSLKGQYPLTPMARYAEWKRADGAPFDPWVRVHWRLGGRFLRITPRGNTVVATVSQWEERTGLRVPESGRYIVPGAFQPIVVDRERDQVRYQEANIWMLYATRRRSR